MPDTKKIVLVTVERARPAVKELEPLLTESGYTVQYSATPSAYTPDELAGAWGLIVGAEPYPVEALQLCGKAKVISRNGIGLDNIDVDTATGMGCAVCNAPAMNHHSVADFTLGLILNLARGIHTFSREMSRGRWDAKIFRGVSGAILGIVGLGRIGKEVALRAQAFHMKVIACDPAPDQAFGEKHGIRFVDFDELLAASDIISMHTPLNSQSESMIDASAISKMKDGVFLINTCRGRVIDEEALAAALDSGKVAGAGLDVFAQEPPGNSPLLRYDNLIASPHIAGNDAPAIQALAQCAVDNLLAIGRGEWPENCVNREALQR